MKLTDAARAFYNGTSELHDSSITWAAFKQAFLKRFRDVGSDQFHFTQLQNAKQNKHETPQEFADRIRALAQRTIPQVDDPEAKKLYQEQADRMALASFTAGLVGVPGRQVRYIMPESLDEAIRVAITVSQAEVQERRNEVFYAEEARECVTARSSRGARGKGDARNTTQYAGSGRTQHQGSEGQSRNLGPNDTRKCFVCGGVGHLARFCATPQNRVMTGNTPSKNKDFMQQRTVGAPRPKGWQNKPPEGTRGRNRSGANSFHVAVPSNDANYFTVRVEMKSGTPTVRLDIAGFYRVFIIDTGSSISLIQPQVSSSPVEPTRLAPFGVTGSELQIQGTQRVDFRVNDRKFIHQFCVCLLPTDADGIIGMDFLSARRAVVDLESRELRLLKCSDYKGEFESRRTCQNREQDKRVALTVFTTQNGRQNSDGVILEHGCGQNTQVFSGQQNPEERKLSEADSWVVKTTETIRLVPRAKQIVIGKLETIKSRVNPELVCVEPARLPHEGVLVARGLSRAIPLTTAPARSKRAMARVTSCDDQLSGRQPSTYVHVMVANFSHEQIELPKATILGLAEETPIV